MLNRNDGITNADYYGRADYQKTFGRIFQELRERGAFTRSVREIENTDLFKLSPFKALTPDQAIAVEDILNGLFEDIESKTSSRIIIDGDPGTGKTVVAVYLMKLLQDIKVAGPSEAADSDSILSEFFVEGYPQLLAGFRVGLVVPQQSLRKSIEKVFIKTPGLDPSMVLTPFEVGETPERFDLLIVDETHRLTQRSSQSSGHKNAQFRTINERLFVQDDMTLTQLDWITRQSDNQIFLLDAAQSVRPHDVDKQSLEALLSGVDERRRHYRLTVQMRVHAGADYVSYVRRIFSPEPPEPERFPGYDLRMFDDLAQMFQYIRDQDDAHGLARIVAGYAWPWRSRRDASAYDIELDGIKLRWNSTDVDWVSSTGSRDEVGSIHTIQGYDLNYAGVIIGKDLRYDPRARRLIFDRANYFDSKGKENNRARGIIYTDDDILRLVTNIYSVLMTRGMLGTYVYVCDDHLRHYLRRFFPNSGE